jgi:enediyne biosynthesis protein E4
MIDRRLLWLRVVACSCLALTGCPAGDRSKLPESGAARRAADEGHNRRVVAPPHPAESAVFIQFRDATQQSGIDFVHQDGSTGEFHLMETMTGGLALFDWNGDDLIDIFFCTGFPLDDESNEAQGSPASARPVLYQNLGDLRFRDVTATARLEGLEYGLGVTVGDFDNDGFPDLYLSNFGPNQLWRNNGDGTFSLETAASELANGDRFGAGVCFADVNGDSGLDLVVGNYVQYSRRDIQHGGAAGRQQYASPQDFPAETSSLLINNLDGRWSDGSLESGLGSMPGSAMGIICGDFDEDGSIDIYVVNDEMQNFLFLNDGQGVFREAAFSLGVAVDAAGRVNGSMGVDCADVDNDGRADLLVTSFERELVTLYRATEHGVFVDATRSSRLGEGTAPHVTWGCCWGDLDNDGDRDAFIASGHLDQRQDNPFYRVANLVMQNEWVEQQRLIFRNVTKLCGDVDHIAQCSRGAAVGDLDNDGDLDLIVLNRGAPPTLLENRTQAPEPRYWLQLELVGRSCNRDAIGARVRLTTPAGDLTLYDEVRSGRGYQSHWGNRLHFGLGSNSKIDEIEVSWPDGTRQVIAGPSVNQRLKIVQPVPSLDRANAAVQ